MKINLNEKYLRKKITKKSNNLLIKIEKREKLNKLLILRLDLKMNPKL
jgi:hypothetical protein